MPAAGIIRMLEAVLSTKDQELTCAQLDEEQLARYAELDLSGESPGEHLPHVQHHLNLCPDCRREYAEVREMLRLEREGAWIEPTTQPVFDLSFLTPQEHEPGLWVQIGSRVRRYVDRIPALLLPQLEQSGQLPRGLRLSYASAAPARMRGPQAEVSAVSFQLTDPEEHLQIQVQIDRVSEEAVWLTVRPTDIMRQRPLSGASVGLLDEANRLLELRAVSAEGLVQFRDVRIKRAYVLRIERERERWEISIDLDIEEA